MAKIVLDGIARDVVVERGPNGTVVSVDGRRHDVKDIIPLAGALAFFDGRVSHVAYVSTGAAGSRISLNGRTYLRTDARIDEDRPSRGAGGIHDGRIEAPMPGGIIAIHVKAGDTVKTGDPIAVLESMKMHNEITAPIDGVIRRINCKPGDQVSFGHVLAEIGADG
jgi:biotin carboxyl carrier protein